ncbi:MAG TPA: hypothetical protein VNQ79_01820 [Blastocatellia bacterium]|nr:hypothetical protein [Blastocatellia bacterium]
MQNTFLSEEPARNAPGPKPAKKLYSIPALLRDRTFAGQFETSTGSYEFTYAPHSARLSKGKLELTGSLNIGAAGGAKHEVRNVRATLAATQGGIYGAPAAIVARLRSTTSSLPITESTGPLGFVGVMYFRLSPINASAAGLNIDLSSVQLNARLAPLSDTEREMQVIFSDLVAAAYGPQPNLSEAGRHLTALNRLLGQA